MSLLVRMRKQRAIYWSQLSVDAFGARTYEAPIEVVVRWDDKSSQYVNKDNEQVASRATVYVGQDMKAGDMLLLGILEADSSDLLDSSIVPTPDDPKEAGAWEIQSFAKIPNLRASEFLRICYL